MYRHTLGCVTLSVLLVLTASAGALAAQGEAGAGTEPELVDMDVRPVLRNVADAERALDRLYPATLKEAGIEGVAGVWIRIDKLGRVRETRLQETSGYLAMDEAAERVAALMSFEPARRADTPIAVWIPMDIRFRLGDDDTTPAEAAPEARTEPMAEPEPEAGETVAPRVRNRAEISRALSEHYPPMLRDAGIGARVGIRVFVDANGRVQDVHVAEASGYDAFNEAAIRVARIMRFAPALNGGTPVPVWVGMDLNFEADDGSR